MGKHQNNAKVNIPLRVAAVLLCLTLVSTYFVSGLQARYSTSGQSGNSAGVAKFSIEGSGTLLQPIEARVSPGDPKPATLIIENKSEVAVEYSITVTNVTNNLPLRFRMEKDEVSLAVDADGTTFTAQQIPGNHSDTYVLHIDWDATKNNPDLWMGRVDYITVKVTATQID